MTQIIVLPHNVVGTFTELSGVLQSIVDQANANRLTTSTNVNVNSITTSADATIHGATVGLGSGSITSNSAVGTNALQSNTTGANNTANGVDALQSNTTGSGNTAVGNSAASTALTNTNSTFVGYSAAPLATSGDSEIVIGASLTGKGSNTALIGGTAGVYANGPFISAGYTVATLPAGVQGMRAFVTDATSPTFLGSLTGGGTVVTPVFFDGSAWVAG